MIKKKATLKDLKDFRNWLEGKNGRYSPQDAGNCLVCQYMKDRGATAISFSGPSNFYYHHKGGSKRIRVRLPVSIAEIAYGEGNPKLDQYKEIDYTYEAARSRADHAIYKAARERADRAIYKLSR